MARKVFISVLGTGFYGKCKYIKDDFVSTDTRFIQRATLELLNATEWREADTALFLLTSRAKAINWDKIITERKHFTANENIPYKGLERVLEEMKLPFSPSVIDIPEGKDEKEMWEIFDKLYKSLDDNDELYFDLTHSFRYLPMLVLVFGNYVKFLKNAKVKHISYGNYEARNTETNEAPIIDLLSISELQDWTFASADYLENGNVERLTTLCTSFAKPILKETKGQDKNAYYLNQFAKLLKAVVEERQTCRGINIIESTSIKGLKKVITEIPEITIEPMKPIFVKIKDSIDNYDENTNIENGFKAAFWCLGNGLYQQAVTIFHENVVSYLCEQTNLNWKEQSQRECVNTALTIYVNNIDEDKWKISSKKEEAEDMEFEIKWKKSKIKSLLSNEQLRLISKPFMKMNDLRNDFNHSGMRNNPMSVESLKDKLAESIKEVLNVINQ